MPSILLVDDEPDIIEILEIFLEEQGMDVLRTSSAKEALEMLRRKEIDVVVSDIRMPDVSGVELLKEIRSLAPETVVVLITAYAGTDTAIDALQHGAFDYLTKPFKMEDLLAVIHRSLERKNLKQEIAALKNEVEAEQGRQLFQALHRSRLIGKSPKMLEVYRTIGTVAMGESTILITGESGTGKELVARAIHEASQRNEGPFVSVNCGAFPETLLESELFGYVKGAFTGAVSNKKGLLEAARSGSLFLDEIGDMTPPMQVKLLRALQERKVRPLGGTSELPVDVRVIAATNRDLQAAIRESQFREDLYYRIAVIAIDLPPLRERGEDIGLLSFHFLRQYAEKSRKGVTGISREALACLEGYPWPGNVRELENTIERAVALESEEKIQIERLPDAVRRLPPAAPDDVWTLPDEELDLEAFLAGIERNLICQALKRTRGNQTTAARQLKLTKPSLRHKIQALGIDPSVYRPSSVGSRKGSA